MAASHNSTATAETKAAGNKAGKAAEKDRAERAKFTILPGVGLVDLNAPGVAGKLAERLAGSVSEQLLLFATRMQEGLMAASVAIGLDVMAEFMEADVTSVAGPKGKHDPDRSAYRHGREQTNVVLGGRRVEVSRPRVRSTEGTEGHLESYEALSSADLLTAHTVAAMLAGLSTRRYHHAGGPTSVE